MMEYAFTILKNRSLRGYAKKLDLLKLRLISYANSYRIEKEI